jgi:branched-chain amino acid transport system substrate-binding protein
MKQLLRLCFVVAALATAGRAQAAEIVVAQAAPASGLLAHEARAYAHGLQLGFAQAARRGPHNFRLVRRDDAGHPDDTVAVTRALLAAERPLVLAGYVGSRNVAALVEQRVLEDAGIALVGYRTAVPAPASPWLFNVRAGLTEELVRIAEHLATVGLTRLVLVAESGPGSPDVLAAAQQAARGAGAQLLGHALLGGAAGPVMAAVDLVEETGAQAVVLVAPGGSAAAFIEQHHARGGAARIVATSSAEVVQLAKRLSDEQLRGVAIAQVAPSPHRSGSRLAREFQEAVAAGGPPEVPVGFATMEGFIAARVIAEAARRAGPAPTRLTLVRAIEAMDIDFGGYGLNYRAHPRVGSRFVELSIVGPQGRLRQ